MLWELTSLSFVVDYFVNIQDVLGNLRFSYFDLVPDTTFTSEKTRVTRVIFLSDAKPLLQNPNVEYSLTSTDYNAGELHQTFEIFKRTALTHADSLVKLDFNVPSLGQVENLVALALSKLST